MLGGLYRTGLCGASRRTGRCCSGMPRNPGFTVIEVMIVLAVTGLLFVSAAVLINGKQNQTEFDQSIRQIQAQIQQAINEVGSGFYPNMGNIQCNGAGGTVALSKAAGTGQGANAGCIFLGKAMQFRVGSSDPEKFNIFTIAGLQKGGAGGSESTSLSEAIPKVVAPSSIEINLPDSTVTESMPGKITTRSMFYNNGAVNMPIGIVAFTLSLASYGTSGAINSGSQQVDVVPVDDNNINSGLAKTKTQAVDAINSNLKLSPVNPSRGVYICFVSGTTNQSGQIIIGNKNRQLSVTLNIKSGTACS